MGINISHTACVHYAAQDGRASDLVYHLRFTGASALNTIEGRLDQRTVVHLAAEAGHSECIKVLYEAGADLNRKDRDGFTALHLAAGSLRLDTLRLLIKLGADVNARTRFGITALHLAASVGRNLMVEVLLASGANLNTQESWGLTPLMIATQKGHQDVLRVLLKWGADKELKDHYHGQTALHIACAARDKGCLLVLLDAGSNVNVANKKGCSPLGVAVVSRFFDAVPFLFEYGAVPSGVDREYIPVSLLTYLEIRESRPLSLLRLARIAFRKSVMAWDDRWLAVTTIPEELKTFVVNIQNFHAGESTKTEMIK